MTDTRKKGGVSRRSMLKGTAAVAGLAAGAGAITGFPTVWSQTKVTLRQFGDLVRFRGDDDDPSEVKVDGTDLSPRVKQLLRLYRQPVLA